MAFLIIILDFYDFKSMTHVIVMHNIHGFAFMTCFTDMNLTYSLFF